MEMTVKEQDVIAEAERMLKEIEHTDEWPSSPAKVYLMLQKVTRYAAFLESRTYEDISPAVAQAKDSVDVYPKQLRSAALQSCIDWEFQYKTVGPLPTVEESRRVVMKAWGQLQRDEREIERLTKERDAAEKLIEAAFVQLGWATPSSPEQIFPAYDSLKAHVQAKYAQHKANADTTPPPADTGAGDAETYHTPGTWIKFNTTITAIDIEQAVGEAQDQLGIAGALAIGGKFDLAFKHMAASVRIALNVIEALTTKGERTS
jgi:hypothetical protein